MRSEPRQDDGFGWLQRGARRLQMMRGLARGHVASVAARLCSAVTEATFAFGYLCFLRWGRRACRASSRSANVGCE